MQVTARWIRGVAIAVNVLAFIRQLAAVIVFGQTVNLGVPPVHASAQLLWIGVTLAAPVLAIVAINAVTTNTGVLQRPAPISN
jgi:hypothetical protein